MSSDSFDVAGLRDAVRARHQDLVDLASALIKIPTTVGNEEAAQMLIADRLEATGFDVSRVTPDAEAAATDPLAGYPSMTYDGRFSVVGMKRGTGTGPSLHLNGHVDVVPVEDEAAWTHDPWTATVDSGRIWGRGAGDMKAGLAACIIAAESIASISETWPGDLIVSSVIEEECTGNGMWSLVREGIVGDATIIGESTDLMVDHGGTGVVWINLMARDTPGHAMTAGPRGAFDELTAAYQALRGLERNRNTPPRDAAFAEVSDWPFSMSVGSIGGGAWTSAKPACLNARARVGFGRDTDPETVQSEIRETVAAVTESVEVSFEAFRAPAYWHRPEGRFFDLLANSHREIVGSKPGTIVGTGTTDARYIPDPCFCYGPFAGNFHGVDEWVDIESLKQAAEVIALTGARWISSDSRPGPNA